MTPSTADLVLAALRPYDLNLDPNGEYRCNSPFRAGSNSHALTIRIGDDGEHGAWKDHVSDEGGSLYQLAEQLGIREKHDKPTVYVNTKRRYTGGLAEYAATHHAPLQAYKDAGWTESSYSDRPALAIQTKTGTRYRLLDTEVQPFRSPRGYHRSWYRLHEAIVIAQDTHAPLILCNGEPSTVAAQYHGVPATCITGSGERKIPATLLTELCDAWDGPIVVALDCDDTGRKKAIDLVNQLRATGLRAHAVDLGGEKGYDLADFCGAHQSNAIADLISLPATDAPVEKPEVTRQEALCTDLSNARRLVAQHGADLRYVKEWGWLVWDGARWQIDQTGEVSRRAKATTRSIYQEAADAPEHLKKDLARHAIASQSHGRLASMIALAESEIEVRTTPDAFDTNDWLLTCANGTLDLRTGQIRPHNRADMLTKAIDVAYNPQSECPQFLAFLDRIFASDTALIAYVQRMIGYMLTGSTGAQCMFIGYGTGANGKSVLIDVIRSLLSEYARNADASTFMAQQSDRIRSDIARLAGVRFVSTIELDEGRRLSEALVKQIAGGDVLTARFLHKDEFEFKPRFKLFMATNHKPAVRGTDYAIWRRIRLIPFNVTIPEAERDPDLADKLCQELPGILAWAMRGCLDWQRSGLQEPEQVQAATNAYRSEQDVIGLFLDEECTIAPRAKVACKALYAAYEQWCENGGERPINQRRFGAQMTERGFDRARCGANPAWNYIGIGLLTDPTDLTDPNIRISTREDFTKEKPGKLDQIDQLDQSIPDPGMRSIPRRPVNVNDLARKRQEEAEAAALAELYPDDDD